jgi:hypothetical protein
MQKIIAILFFGQISLFSLSQTYSAKQTSHYFNWGGKRTEVLVSEYSTRRNVVLLNLHSDETTSAEAARNVLGETGGIFIQILNDEERLISFQNAGKDIRFDPNRIFTAAGLQQNLEKLNGRVSKKASKLVREFSEFILKLIPKNTKSVIAPHNNDNDRYSIGSYQPGGDYAADVSKIHINTRQDADDFFLTTDPGIFSALKNENFNTILQNNRKAKDDGSLSIYYGRKKKSYVNVEAEHQHLDRQIEMLRLIISLL